jgi:hypothetical protein
MAPKSNLTTYNLISKNNFARDHDSKLLLQQFFPIDQLTLFPYPAIQSQDIENPEQRLALGDNLRQLLSRDSSFWSDRGSTDGAAAAAASRELSAAAAAVAAAAE